MPELATILREVVDTSAEPVTVAEVMGLPEAVPRNRRRWPLITAAAALVGLCGVAGVLVATHDAGDRATPIATTAPPAAVVSVPVLGSCIRDDDGGGCSVSDEQAGLMLETPVNQPSGIPADWTLVHHEVRRYPDGPTITEYNRSWFRDPDEARPAFAENTMLECYPTPCDLPDYVQLIVQVGLPLTTSRPFYDEVARLDDGAVVNGFLRNEDHYLSWRRGDVTYRLRASGIDADTALRIANSLA